jgi:hypothetical protein
MLSSFVQSPRPGQKHACHQNAERDVIESMRENVNDSRPIALTLARKRAISRWTFPHSVKRPRGETYSCCWLGPIASLPLDPLLTQSRRVQAKSRRSAVGLATLLFSGTPGHARRIAASVAKLPDLPPRPMVLLANLNPPINPAWSQPAGSALRPSPFYIFEPHQPSMSCSVGDGNWTPREPAMPVHV